jgi:hypothetical protein
MNENLARLKRLLGSDMTEQALIDALYTVRASRRLVGIIPAMRQFQDWRRKYPQLARAPDGIKDYAGALRVLDQIAQLDTTDETLSGGVISKYSSPWTPLRPQTGDSVIGELLLVRAGDGVDAQAFEEVSVWLLRCAQEFHTRTVKVEAYASYLQGDIDSLQRYHHGSRLYQAYLALRTLADGSPGGDARLRALEALFRKHGHSDGFHLALLLSLTKWAPTSREHSRLCQKAAADLGMSPRQVVIEAGQVHSCLPLEFALVLRTIFEAQLVKVIGSRGGARGGAVGRTSLRPRITHGTRLTEILQSTDEGDLHAGTVAEFFPVRQASAAEADGADREEDDPDELPTNPGFSVFLAQSDDLVQGYYAAMGVQSAIEYENARLPWSKWTLSSEALQAILHLVAGHGAEPNEASLDREARLAIGLCLISGRDLDQVAGAAISDGAVDIAGADGLVIQRPEHVLYARAGEPKLRRGARALSPFCRPRASSLRLPLPDAWRSLAASIQSPRPRRARVIERARTLLARFRAELAVSSKGLRSALPRALDELTRGDLGVIAVLTEGAEANARNIIHYASYEAAQIETWWRQAAESLIDTALGPPLTPPATGWVGAQDAFDEEALASYFGEIRNRLQDAKSRGDWPRAFNLLTLYLALWLGLGLAQRRTRNPAPRLVLMDGWVWVGDKRRPDGSTDRIVPITPALRAQIDAYIALASELAVLQPGLDPLVVTEHGVELRLFYLRTKPSRRDNPVVPYAPSIQETHEKLRPLPANWGRKVARTLSTALPGRLRDAELGHWVRGRHAWDATSTLDVRGFRSAWLGLQEDLEERLGFEVIEVARCSEHRRPSLQRSAPVPTKAMKAQKSASPKASSTVDGKAVLTRVGDLFLDRLTSADPADRPGLALDLLRRVVGEHDTLPIEEQLAVADAACVHLRKTFKVPIFAVPPRFLIAQPIVLNAAALHTLGYAQQHVLPAFERELACLPPRVDLIATPNAMQQRRVELGRLVMIGIWRLGLARWRLIEAWLKALGAETPILAQGENRYMTFRVRSGRKGVTMRRTVLLDDFTAAYLTLEGGFIRESLLPALAAKRARHLRSGSIEAALNAYLKSIGVGDIRISLGAMMDAAAQQLMLDSTPIVAAYARGQLDTEDLGDGELRRLGGLVPQRAQVLEDDSLPETRIVVMAGGEPPKDVIAESPVIQALTCHRSPYMSEWRRLIKLMKANTPVEALLRAFALWLLDESGQRFTLRRKQYFVNRIRVLAYAMLGHADPREGWRVLNGDTLRRLQDLTRDHFPDRLQHGAWYQLHRFLASLGPNAKLGGLEIRDLGRPPVRAVSAKILSPGQLDQLQHLLVSPRSGIGNAVHRTCAQRHVTLMSVFGLRRSESAFLRAVDYQTTLCRVQPYGDHTLKTAAADRVLPVAFADADLAASMARARADGHDRLIDSAPQRPVNPENLYDPLSRLIKLVTQNDSMGSHHLRHTLVSQMVLTFHWESAAISGLVADLPWLNGMRLESDRLRALLGSEGDAGQGMRALSALIGHGHPNTTIRHYTHVLCIALRGALNARDQLDLRRSFENRVGGRASLKRWVHDIEVTESAEGGDRRRRINRLLRARIERRTRFAGIHIDETPLPPAPVFADTEEPGEQDEHAIRFDRLEAVDRSLRDRHPLLPAKELERAKKGLEQLHAVRSGKNGLSDPRHPLECLHGDTWLPAALAAGQATAAAAALCDWLEELRCQKGDDFAWLLDKWIYASESERGRMLLKDDSEVARAKQLGDGASVQVEVGAIAVSARDRGQNPRSRYRMRIQCLDRVGRKITRDTSAVRWVMSYIAVLQRLVPKQPSWVKHAWPLQP